MPYPSGRNRWWDRPENLEAARLDVFALPSDLGEVENAAAYRVEQESTGRRRAVDRRLATPSAYW